MKNTALKKTVIPILPGLLLAALAACGDPPHESPEPARPVVRARSAEAVRAEIPILIELQGVVEAERIAAVSARVMATVTGVHAQAGDRVRPGQLLLTIDAEAAQGQVSQARGALAQARAALALAERNHQRFQALAAADAASALEVEMARMQYEQALGAVEQAEGAVAAASSVAGDSRVVAPFAGRVARRMVDVGDLAAPGRPLLLIESEGGRRLALPVPESVVAAAGLEVGSALAVTLDSHPHLGEMAGTVVEMTPGADPTSHSFDVKVALAVPDLATGAAGRAAIAVGRRESVTVPAAAVLRHGGLELVVVAVDGRTSSRAVTTGQETGQGSVEILSGLAGGERVLVGLEALPPAGSPVEEAG